MFDLFELYLHEDCPYEDETTELLKIEGEGVLRIITRVEGVSACTEDLAEFYMKKGLEVLDFVKSGENFKAGDEIFKAKGDAKKLFKLWRISQTFLSITCAIATKTSKLVSLATSVNSNVIIATTRKTHPGMRKFEIRAVIAGGGCVHRNSLSDSILITPNHLNFIDDLKEIRSMRKIEIEPRNEEEALKFAKIADVILLDHYTPEELKELIPKLKSINPNLKVAVAGNVNEDDVKEFAKFADIIVTSAPYYAKPLDFTTKIERI
jgi:putative molybdenum utilization protein ModD